MPALDAFWHLLNFFGPAIGIGLLAPSLAKLLWRRALAGVAWSRLSAWACSACVLVLIVGLCVFGHDGAMATYAAMVVVCALTLWWRAFGLQSR